MNKNRIFLLGVLVLSTVRSQAELPACVPEAGSSDSIHTKEMEEVVVQGIKAHQKAPFAVSEVKAEELASFSRQGQELPFLLARTPGVVAWSENGLGTGTTYMRIRGAADSRINVTLDGVPLNSPEDQCVFWANTNGYASLLKGIQVQRGVGTSTNGDGAFGGSIAMNTRFPSSKPEGELAASYGSYNTWRAGGNFSSGLLCNHLIIDGAYHHTGTDGYLHGTDGQAGSFYGGLTYVGLEGDLIVRYRNLGNYEHTGQAWNGVDTGGMLQGNYCGQGIKDYGDMFRLGLGRYNTLYEHLLTEDDPLSGTERYRLADGSLWKHTTDNFRQDRHLLSTIWQIDRHWSTTATLHYMHGYGYYEEFKPSRKLGEYGLADFQQADGSLLKKTDFIRQKGLGEDQGGFIWNFRYQDRRWTVDGGLSTQLFRGKHFGYLTYTANQELSSHLLQDGRHTYYDSRAWKGDQSSYLKGLFRITPQFSAFADVQYRYVHYFSNGYNDKYRIQENGTPQPQALHINQTYNFLNPKVGLSYQKGGNQAYASLAVSHREPERNNFTDNGSYPAPVAESVLDYEAGYRFSTRRWHAGAGLYYMDYRNQFVQTGALSDIGEALTTNIAESYRMGAELTAGIAPLKWFALEGNATLSQGRIRDFDEVVDNWDGAPIVQHYSHSTLGFSPSLILNGFADFRWQRMQATWHTGYVSRQYLDNTQCRQRSLPAYCRTDINLSYHLSRIDFGLDLGNIFNRHYASSGWVYSAVCESLGHTLSNRYTQMGYIPMSGFTLMGSVKVKL